MSRAKWKGPYFNDTVENKELNPSNDATIASRNCGILPLHKGSTFKVHNGKTYLEILVTEDMVGHKFGEFVFTRAKFSFKKKKSKKRKK